MRMLRAQQSESVVVVGRPRAAGGGREVAASAAQSQVGGADREDVQRNYRRTSPNLPQTSFC